MKYFSLTISVIIKESLNGDGQQFHQYQQNKQLPLTFNNSLNNLKDHDI